MGLLGSLFSAAADIAKETITETMNQNETEKFIKIMMERDAQNAEAYDYRFISWTVSEINSYMNLLTSEDKTLDLPMVVAEWNKKIRGA